MQPSLNSPELLTISCSVKNSLMISRTVQRVIVLTNKHTVDTHKWTLPYWKQPTSLAITVQVVMTRQLVQHTGAAWCESSADIGNVYHKVKYQVYMYHMNPFCQQNYKNEIAETTTMCNTITSLFNINMKYTVDIKNTQQQLHTVKCTNIKASNLHCSHHKPDVLIEHKPPPRQLCCRKEARRRPLVSQHISY